MVNFVHLQTVQQSNAVQLLAFFTAQQQRKPMSFAESKHLAIAEMFLVSEMCNESRYSGVIHGGLPQEYST